MTKKNSRAAWDELLEGIFGKTAGEARSTFTGPPEEPEARREAAEFVGRLLDDLFTDEQDRLGRRVWVSSTQSRETVGPSACRREADE